jgi:flavin reductase (DIM6/NTAB) family NADH-FMN oxidoreductase RutF
MSEPTQDIASALGRIPSGIFILTTAKGRRSTGMLASWVQQAGFDPPMVTVAVRQERYIAEWIAVSGRFTLNQVAAGNKELLKHFGKGFDIEEEAFEGIELIEDHRNGLILKEALAFLSCEVAGSIDSGDHRIFLASVVQGQRMDHEAEPMVHLRRSGSHY